MRVLVIGKCHSRGIASSWQALRPEDSVSSVTWVQLRKGYGIPRLIDEVREADQVFVEADADGTREWSPRELGLGVDDPSVPRLASSLEHATLYPVFHFTGFHPDFSRIEKTGCSQIAVAAHALGLSESRAAELFNGYIYRALGYYDEYPKAQGFALHVGRASGYDLSGVLQPVDGKAFMHIPTQPTIGFWMRFAGMLCEQAGLPYDPAAPAPADEPAEELIWPVYPELAEPLGVQGGLDFKVSKGKPPISFEEMISTCYRILDSIDAAEVRERTHTRAIIAKLRAELAG